MREGSQHFLSRVMTLDKDNILSSSAAKAVETCFPKVFPSTPFNGQVDRRNNYFQRFLILISRVLALIKSHFFCSANRTLKIKIFSCIAQVCN